MRKAFVAVTFMCALLACSREFSPVGVWNAEVTSTDPEVQKKLDSIAPSAKYFDFKADSTVLVVVDKGKIPGTYKVEGSKLIFMGPGTEGEPKQDEFTISEDHEMIMGSLGDLSFRLTRRPH